MYKTIMTITGDIKVRNSTHTLASWFDDLALLTVGDPMGPSAEEGAEERWPVYENSERVGTLFEDACGLSYAPEDERVGSDAYKIVCRSRNSRSLVTGLGEIMSVGNEGLDLYDALVERDARNLLRPEGSDSWDIEPEPPEDWRDRVGSNIEPSAVAAYMVKVLGIGE